MHQSQTAHASTLLLPSTSSTRAVSGTPKFSAEDVFYRELRRRVDRFFQERGLNPRDCPRMYVKTAIVLGWCTASYVLLVFAATSWSSVVPLVISLALSLAAVGFNISHDGGHGAYSERPWLNKLMALTTDLLGGSSHMWDRKHNVLHHTYANIMGHDDDIDVGPFGRISPHQPRLSLHRFQHIYLWFLYGFLAVKWQLYDDFRDVVTARVGGQPHRRPQGWDTVVFFGGKLAFLTLAWAIPMCFHPVWAVLAAYVAVTFVQGLAVSFVFQLPHCGDEADFPMPDAETGRMEAPWSVHQVQATVDYARGNPLVTWYVGGLNFQIEHHLLPRICHIHYPALAPLVQETCREYGVQYKAHRTFRGALASHYRQLRRMGQPDAA